MDLLISRDNGTTVVPRTETASCWVKVVAQKKIATIGQRGTDLFSSIIRSWKFVLFQLTFISLWILLNGTRLVHLDPYPFDMLKLILTVEISFIGSIILMSQNRQAAIDRRIVYQDYIINYQMKKEVDQILPLVRKDHANMGEVLDILKKEKAHLDKPNA